MASGNGKATNDVSDFPPVTELAQFHVVLNDIRNSIGTNHDDVPESMLCIVLRDGQIEQYVLAAPEGTLPLLGALEFVKAGMIEMMMCEGEDE